MTFYILTDIYTHPSFQNCFVDSVFGFIIPLNKKVFQRSVFHIEDFAFNFSVFFFQDFLPLYLTHLHGRSKKIFRYYGMSKDLGPAVESKAVDRKLDVRVK